MQEKLERAIKAVEEQNEKSVLLLTAEMKMPGIASLCFKLKKTRNGKIILDQIACYVPRGLWGLIYWQHQNWIQLI